MDRTYGSALEYGPLKAPSRSLTLPPVALENLTKAHTSTYFWPSAPLYPHTSFLRLHTHLRTHNMVLDLRPSMPDLSTSHGTLCSQTFCLSQLWASQKTSRVALQKKREKRKANRKVLKILPVHMVAPRTGTPDPKPSTPSFFLTPSSFPIYFGPYPEIFRACFLLALYSGITPCRAQDTTQGTRN